MTASPTKALLALVLAALCAIPVAARAADERDGNWWLGLPASTRVFYVVGLFDGIQYELHNVTQELVNPLAEIPAGCDKKCVELRAGARVQSWKALLEKHDSDFDRITAGQITTGLDSLFGDYRNRSIKVHAALEVVIGSIRGVSPALVEIRLQGLRSGK